MEQENYSPFWICLVVFIAIFATGISQSTALFEQREMVKVAEKNTAQIAEKYKTAQTKIENLAKDLVALSATNENAKKIVQEFNIKVNSPLTGTSKPATPSKSTTPSPAKK